MAVRELKWFPLACKLKDFLLEYTYSNGTPLFNYLVDRESLKITVGKNVPLPILDPLPIYTLFPISTVPI
jgi:hypothetical protein